MHHQKFLHEAFFKFAHAMGNMLAPTAAPGLEDAPSICSKVQGLFRSLSFTENMLHASPVAQGS